MKKKQVKKFNIKSEKGFTMADLVMALIIFSLFVGIIGTLFYSSFKLNLQAKMNSTAISYVIQILEDIDKISYEEVRNGMETEYAQKFSISPSYQVVMDVKNYYEGTEREDIIKLVNVVIKYSLAGETKEVSITTLKVKEK